MRKNYIFYILLSAFALIGAGCSIVGNKASGEKNNSAAMQGERQAIAPFWGNNDNFENADIADLIIGKNIFATGETNPDGSISASNIIIANEEQLRGLMSERIQGAPNTLGAGDNSQNPQARNDATGGVGGANKGRDFSQFQNMSDEERQKLRDEFSQRQQQNGGVGNMAIGSAPAGGSMPERIGKRTAGQMSEGRVSGEIIFLDDKIITIKIFDGGSKLVFYTAETAIKKIK